jgi:hypothetical protein
LSKVAIQGDPSGSGTFTIASPNSNSNFTLTIPQATTTIVGTDATQTLTNKTLGSGLVMGASTITSATAQASTSGTSIDFTGIPAYAKRITVMFSGVSTNGTSIPLIRLGTGGTPATTGYLSAASVAIQASTNSVTSYTDGFGFYGGAATYVQQGSFIFTNLSGNTWVCQGILNSTSGVTFVSFVAGSITLGGTLNILRVTTQNGTDTFDAGTINILYE